MERKILKWTTWSFGVLTVAMCTSLYFMPSIKEGFAAAVHGWPELNVQEMPVEMDEDVVWDEDKLNIELVEGISDADVQITSDYIAHKVYVRFAKAVEDYSKNHLIHGNSENVSSVSYYREGTEGVLEISLDKACEPIYSYEKNVLSMEFKDLHEIYDKIIVVDAGHGGSQPGAVKREVYEKHLNLDIVLKLKELLDEVDEKKLKVFYTRLEDTNPSLAERADMANQLDADLFISVHNNSSADGKFGSLNGTMVLYSPDENDDSSKRLAQICLENVNASTGSKNLGLVEADHIYIIRTSEVPVALIEVGYMTNSTELNNLCTPEYQKKVAQGIYNAIMQAFEEGF